MIEQSKLTGINHGSRLKKKKVILTGGSRGLGRAALELYAAEGADIAFFLEIQMAYAKLRKA